MTGNRKASWNVYEGGVFAGIAGVARLCCLALRGKRSGDFGFDGDLRPETIP